MLRLRARLGQNFKLHLLSTSPSWITSELDSTRLVRVHESKYLPIDHPIVQPVLTQVVAQRKLERPNVSTCLLVCQPQGGRVSIGAK